MQSCVDHKLHVGIIMDGNGRWATRQGQPRWTGHQAGAEALRRAVECAPALGIGVLTVYAFSGDNWKRPEAEVSALMELFRDYLQSETERLAAKGVRLKIIGRKDRLAADLQIAIGRAMAATAGGEALHLRIAIDYSARDRILNAALQVRDRAAITLETFSTLVTGEPGLSDVDLLIRTGGEQRLSDFLLWEAAYAELYFSERMWPDFDAEDLAHAVTSFRSRERRFGGLATIHNKRGRSGNAHPSDQRSAPVNRQPHSR